MIRAVLSFVVLWGVIALLISVFRSLSSQEKWETVKMLTYSGFCAIITFVLLMALVVIF